MLKLDPQEQLHALAITRVRGNAWRLLPQHTGHFAKPTPSHTFFILLLQAQGFYAVAVHCSVADSSLASSRAGVDTMGGGKTEEFQMKEHEIITALYGSIEVAPCPFTRQEREELDDRGEMLVYLPAGLKPGEMCRRWGIAANIDFDNERLIRTVMLSENQWFVTSKSKTPELIYQSAQAAKRIYEDDGLHGMDLRRYLAFAATFKARFDQLPDQLYWVFLHSGSYDRSGISVVGFDSHGVLNHHGWMKNFKAKFVGSRYVCIAPRIEVTLDTEALPRAYRAQRGWRGQEAAMDS